MARLLSVLPLLLSPVEGEGLLPPVLDTPLGQVQGKEGMTAGGVPTLEYLGVPYGEPPVGERRFLPPTPIQPWPHTFNATVYGNKCAQTVSTGPDAGQTRGKEDCLNLNIFKAKNEEGLLPVMVWIYGGAFVEGSNQEGTPDPLVEKGVMVVMINYRLGPLGFLTFGNNLVSGNMGIRDQLLALEWVRDNIESYGGDPDKVTIFGESAGGISVHTHVLSPIGAGLYRSAIAQSGTAEMALLEEEGQREERFSAQLATALNCSSSNHDQEMLTCLQNTDTEKLLLVLSDPESLLQVSIQWWIVVDNYADDPVLPKTPLKIMQCGSFKKIPYISGTMKSEGGFVVSAIYDTLDEIEQNWDYMGAFFTGLTINQDPQLFTQEQMILARILRDMYTGNNFTSENLPALLKFFTHVGFLMPDQKTVSLMAKSSSNIYNYQMSFKDTFSVTNFFKPGIDFGPSHADDNYYLFNDAYPWIYATNYTEKEKQMSNIIAQYWTNFAKFSDPNQHDGNSLPRWDPVPSTGETNLLDLSLKPEMNRELDKDKELFWQRMIWDHREGGKIKKRDESCETGFFLSLSSLPMGWLFG